LTIHFVKNMRKYFLYPKSSRVTQHRLMVYI